MIKQSRDKVVPFAMSARQMRRSAEGYLRRGQMPEAVELSRRAAEKENTTLGWLHLAQLLIQACCWEQAEEILHRLLAREEVPAEVWMALARCQEALGQRECIPESLRCCLMEAPYSDLADRARSMLREQEPVSLGGARQQSLINRGLRAMRDGQRELGYARLARAARMGYGSVEIYISLALFYLEDNRLDDALRSVAKGARLSPDDGRVSCMASVLLHHMGKKRAALGMLAHVSKRCNSPDEEEGFVNAALHIGARDALSDYVTDRLKARPYRVPLMHAAADLAWESGDEERAGLWWQRILRMDPGNLRARLMLQWMGEHSGERLPVRGAPPLETIQRLIGAYAARFADEEPLAEDILLPGSDFRCVLDWCFHQMDEGLQHEMLRLIAQDQFDTAEMRQYMRELLTLPKVYDSVRMEVMAILTGRGEAGPFPVWHGAGVTVVACAPGAERKDGMWKAFLARLLMRLRSGRVNGMVECAARVWRVMTQEERMAAVSTDAACWIQAMVIFYARTTGDMEFFMRVADDPGASSRRILRHLRLIAGRLGEWEAVYPEETALPGENVTF